ncbi:ATP-binding protein [Luteimonas sp. MC1825]|uniref:Dph6-related ATP pyrophosphatase n=1 Tax=Luteimonas sp. MC1825 TaxID=2761107 RepID=UPI00160ECC4F|nr:ATP-binding protein [Luteimonas sp. MC1825]MBB6598251.1 ATP-binding protein [Luteimonas sp. MC1825]QOC88467.1 ATP-binding protein [Luteimonas sp. MC1825]
MAPRPVALLAWSGGKDAAWALQALRQRGEVDVVGLLSTISAGEERASLQHVRADVLHAQAAATRLPLLEMRIPDGCDNACYAAAFAATLAEARARWPGITRIAFGDLLLADIRGWREALCARLGWSALFPLFGADSAALARDMLAGGLRAQLCCVDTTQLDAAFSGRDFDADLLDTLPAAVDPCGENGEFHTCVSDGPMFTAPLQLVRGATALRDGRFAVTDYTVGVGRRQSDTTDQRRTPRAAM